MMKPFTKYPTLAVFILLSNFYLLWLFEKNCYKMLHVKKSSITLHSQKGRATFIHAVIAQLVEH